MKKILSIDGGGIRGLIPAIVLTEIELRTGKPISHLFDLIAGTSTGGIIALGLTKPNEQGKPEHSASDLVRFYENEGPKIFRRTVLQQITSLWNLIDEKYPEDYLERILSRYFKQSYLHEALTDVLITAYEIERRNSFFFKSRKAKKEKSRNYLMRHVARATSAAPTYFEPEKIPTMDVTEYFALIDGGVFANNPAMCAYVEAKTMFPDEKDFLVVSLGTGELTKPIYYEKAKEWGVAQWAQPILKVVFDGVNDTVDYQLRKLLPRTTEGRQQYYRLQVTLDEGSDEMDNVELHNLRLLKLYGESIIRDKSELISDLCLQLTK
jgi:uncharacterized protein